MKYDDYYASNYEPSREIMEAYEDYKTTEEW